VIPRAYDTMLFPAEAPREADDVPAYEEVVGEPLRADDGELALEGVDGSAPFIGRNPHGRAVSFHGAIHGRRAIITAIPPHPHREPPHGEPPQHRERLLSVPQRKARKLERTEIEVETAALRYLERGGEGGGIVAKRARDIGGCMEEGRR
jgi:hypothetical protein